MDVWSFSEDNPKTFQLEVSNVSTPVGTPTKAVPVVDGKENRRRSSSKGSTKRQEQYVYNIKAGNQNGYHSNEKKKKKTKRKKISCGCGLKFKTGPRWRHFVETTTLHGMRHVANPSANCCRRTFWMILLIIFILVVFQGVFQNLNKFFIFPVSSLVTLQYVDNVTFPAVTICNYNQWRKSNLTEDQTAFLELLYPTLHVPNESYAWEQFNYTGRNFTQDMLNAAHQKEDMILDCSWQMIEPCGPENFTQIFTDFGVCYTFNNPRTKEAALSVQQTGFDYGLYLRLNVEQYEYYNSFNTGAGIKIMVHGQNEFPFVKRLGFAVSPGAQSLVGLKLTKILNLPWPYQYKCQGVADPEVYTDYNYTVELCQTMCEANYVTEICGCRTFNAPGNAPICDPPMVQSCVRGAEAAYKMGAVKCNCPIPCEKMVYQVRVSEVYWPADHVIEQIENLTQFSEAEIRSNLLEVVLYFEELNFEEIAQVPGYDSATLIGDIGGLMGLLIGASIITVVEFIDFCIVQLSRWYRQRKSRKITADKMKDYPEMTATKQ